MATSSVANPCSSSTGSIISAWGLPTRGRGTAGRGLDQRADRSEVQDDPRLQYSSLDDAVEKIDAVIFDRST